MITIKELPVKEGAKIAISNRLFVPGWQLRVELTNIVKYSYQENKKIVLAYDDNKPVGICLKVGRSLTYKNQLMVFVRKQHRNKSIGRRLVNALKDEYSYGEVGIQKANGRIFRKNNIYVRL